ncbi:phosphonate C-P lyase system protein PhnH [Bordetella flabilis]|uniref:Phosphonate C-P lyase system protein PhnH n=1 Tax=Bordetella flabilis TaxID=463014 RepID=A0A193GIT8_9BORD|nr:phosphonate C-P lyase system protein PhnH [Bordetella flabilis]ANN79336.1 phosphonate C-P lyase system protein PhnH [Bordetella flabilis]
MNTSLAAPRATTSRAATLLPGFADPVAGAQATFRTALQALANPGLIQTIAGDCGVPAGLSHGMTALLLTLADVDTAVWLPQTTDAAVRSFLRFHCGCPLVDDPAQARFVAMPAGGAAPPLDACDPGDPAYPDRSATLLIEVASLDEGQPLTLSGPGIPGTRPLRATGLPADFWTQWAANHRRFPLGVDVVLIQGDRVCGLPRTTRVEN